MQVHHNTKGLTVEIHGLEFRVVLKRLFIFYFRCRSWQGSIFLSFILVGEKITYYFNSFSKIVEEYEFKNLLVDFKKIFSKCIYIHYLIINIIKINQLHQLK